MKLTLLIEMTVKFIPPESAIEPSCGSLPLPLNVVWESGNETVSARRLRGQSLNTIENRGSYGTSES